MGVEKKRAPFMKDALHFTGKLSAALILLYSVSLFAFSEGQVDAIKNRDQSMCQYPGCRNKTKYNVEVHHIVTQGYSKRINVRPDNPWNAVCLCEEHHIGYPKVDAKTKTRREVSVGMNWDPVHPDSYLVHLILSNSFNSLPKSIKEKIDHDFPGLYQYYQGVNLGLGRQHMSYQYMYEVVMRKWRSDRLDNKQIYWDPKNDGNLIVAAINSTLKAYRRGWQYPLRMLGGNVAEHNRGEYAWDNLVAISIEKYILSLSSRDLNVIINKLKKSQSDGRLIYYEFIYSPAVAHFSCKKDVDKLIDTYLHGLPEKEAANLIARIDKARKGSDAYKILFEELYTPAIRGSASLAAQPVASANGTTYRGGLRRTA